jgi:hypothetical protein
MIRIKTERAMSNQKESAYATAMEEAEAEATKVAATAKRNIGSIRIVCVYVSRQ